jgi:C1A family cysteine protease
VKSSCAETSVDRGSALAHRGSSASEIFTEGQLNKFSAFKAIFHKQYPTPGAEAKALTAFVTNEAVIRQHNARNLTYTLGHNQFSDLSWPEFKATYVGKLVKSSHRKNYDYSLSIKSNGTIDAPIDWVDKGAVTSVKNQGQCGSCWAFSTTGALEGAIFVATGSLVSLSEQDLVSCDKNGDQGCNGGLMDNAFEWIKSNGISTEADYPYTSGGGDSGTCRSTTPAAWCTGHRDVPANDEDALLKALTSSPVSVAVEADQSSFQLYKSGVLDNAGCGTSLDHGVMVVGYGTDGGKDY